MVTQINVEGFDEYKKAEETHKGRNVFALFTGTVGKDGNSWCPDCNTADPVIKRNLSKLPEDAVFIHCSVGERSFWKDQKNIFRTDESLKLTCVPTLIRIGGKERLMEEQCAKDDLVEMMFCDE